MYTVTQDVNKITKSENYNRNEREPMNLQKNEYHQDPKPKISQTMI
jgi:hypothetical protein